MMRSFVMLSAVCGALAMPFQARAGSPKCPMSDDIAGVVTSLPHARAALAPGATLNILAIGSASMFGPEASLAPGTLTDQATSGATTSTPPPAQLLGKPSEAAFPQQMVKVLQAALSGVTVQIAVRGGRGLTAADQLTLIQDAVKGGKYTLVIWQTGTVEAVRNSPPGEFAQTLADGAEAVAQSGADLVLIDPQYSRFLQTNSNIDPYEQVFQQVGSTPGVALFRRFDLMRSWVNDGQLDLERTPKAERKRAVEQLHSCLGEHLARFILGAARS